MDLSTFLKQFNNLSQKSLLTDDNFSERIQYIQIGRKPILDTVKAMVDIVTLGKWDSLNRQTYNYDAFMHLFVVVQLYNGNKLRIEKNEQLDIKPHSHFDKIELIDVDIPSHFNSTLIESLKRCADKMGLENMLHNYNYYKNNCQIFVVSYLASNNLFEERYIEFTYQELHDIAQRLPAYSNWIMSNATRLLDFINALRGKGKNKTKSLGENDFKKIIQYVEDLGYSKSDFKKLVEHNINQGFPFL